MLPTLQNYNIINILIEVNVLEIVKKALKDSKEIYKNERWFSRELA